jgi:hypothetical protein
MAVGAVALHTLSYDVGVDEVSLVTSVAKKTCPLANEARSLRYFE